MSKKLQLTIPNPCQENWDNMTPVQQARPDDPVGRGKFCGSCQKQVVDFSNMSDRQVAQFFKKPSTGSVCGRFMTDQLERDIEIPKKRIPWVKYFFQFALPAFLVSIKTSAQKTQGQVRMKAAGTYTIKVPVPEQIIVTMGRAVARPICNKPLQGDVKITPAKKTVVEKTIKGDTVLLPEVVITAITPAKNGEVMGKVSFPYQALHVTENIIIGKVVDEKGAPVPYASVIIKGARTGMATDANGSFSITPLAGWNNIILVGSSAGFELTEVLVDKKNLSDFVIIQLRPVLKGMLVGELVVCRKPVIKKELKHVPLMPDIADDKAAIAFKVFPNPVESGSSLNIEIKKAAEGYYYLQWLNQSGQSVHKQEIWIDAEAGLLNIDIPPVAAGVYFLALSNKKSGRKYTEKILIQ